MRSLFTTSSRLEGFRDRVDAGAQLTDQIFPLVEHLATSDIVVVGLARGGVIVAAEIARQLDTRLEAIVVRKLGTPGQPELALGAIAVGGYQDFNQSLIDEFDLTDETLQEIIGLAENAAERLCREIGAPISIPDLNGKTVILVDDGMATGATMRASIKAVNNQRAHKVIVALPIAPNSAQASLQTLADEVVILLAPSRLRSVGQWYQAFPDVPSIQVKEALQANPHRDTS